MRVLALDAATEACSVALLANGALISRTIESGKSNAQKILSMAEMFMALLPLPRFPLPQR